MQSEEKTLLRWVKLYKKTLDAELVCLRCGVSRPTLEKWLRRYRKYGEAGLKSLSRRPATSPKKKVMEYGIKFRPNKPASPHLNGESRKVSKD